MKPIRGIKAALAFAASMLKTGGIVSIPQYVSRSKGLGKTPSK